MREARPAFLLAALGAMVPSVGVADTIASTDGAAPIADGHGSAPEALVIAAVAVLLLVAVMLAIGRMPWRLGALVMIGCAAMLGGGAIVDGIETVIAVSP